MAPRRDTDPGVGKLVAPVQPEPAPPIADVHAELAAATEAPRAVVAAPHRRDTLPDKSAEMQSLLDGLMPRDGRYPLPTPPPAEHGAQSTGRDFVAYSGEARLPPRTPTADPLPAVLVKPSIPPNESLSALALAAMDAAEKARLALEPTYVAPRRTSGWMWLVGVTSAGVIVAIVMWLRAPEPPSKSAETEPARAPVAVTPRRTSSALLIPLVSPSASTASNERVPPSTPEAAGLPVPAASSSKVRRNAPQSPSHVPKPPPSDPSTAILPEEP